VNYLEGQVDKNEEVLQKGKRFFEVYQYILQGFPRDIKRII